MNNWKISWKYIEGENEHIFTFTSIKYPNADLVYVRTLTGKMWSHLRNIMGIKKWYPDENLDSYKIPNNIPNGLPHSEASGPPPWFFIPKIIRVALPIQSDNSIRPATKEQVKIAEKYGDCSVGSVHKRMMKEDPVYGVKFMKAQMNKGIGATALSDRLKIQLDRAVRECKE